MKKRTHKRARAQVVIPPNPALARHADAIRELGRRCFEDMVAIGEHLAACRKLLKSDRHWLAWLAEEFSWSRRTADRFIDLHKGRDKLRNLRTLPVAALYQLARASPRLVQIIEQRVAAGDRPKVEQVRMLVSEEASRSAAYQPRGLTEVLPGKPLGGADLHAAAVNSFVRQLETFAEEVRHCGLTPQEILTATPEERRPAVVGAARSIAAFMHEVARGQFEGERLKLVDTVAAGDDGGTRH